MKSEEISKNIEWAEEALKELNKLPFWRKKIKEKVENCAQKEGITIITVEFLNSPQLKLWDSPSEKYTIKEQFIFLVILILLITGISIILSIFFYQIFVGGEFIRTIIVLLIAICMIFSGWTLFSKFDLKKQKNSCGGK